MIPRPCLRPGRHLHHHGDVHQHERHAPALPLLYRDGALRRQPAAQCGGGDAGRRRHAYRWWWGARSWPPARRWRSSLSLASRNGCRSPSLSICLRNRCPEGPVVAERAAHPILRKYRRQGIGAVVAQEIRRRSTGVWDVRVLESNQPAQAFWEVTISAFTRSRVEAIYVTDRLPNGWITREQRQLRFSQHYAESQAFFSISKTY